MRSSFCLSFFLSSSTSVSFTVVLLSIVLLREYKLLTNVEDRNKTRSSRRPQTSTKRRWLCKILAIRKKNPLKILISASWYRSAPKSVASRTSHPSIKFHRQQHLSYPVKRHTDKHIGLKNNLLGRGNNTLIMPASWNNHSSKVYITAYIRHVCKI